MSTNMDKLTYHLSDKTEVTAASPVQAYTKIITRHELNFLKEFMANHPSILKYINTPNIMEHSLTPFNVALQLYLIEKRPNVRDILYAIMDLLLSNNAKPNITTITGQSIYDFLDDQQLLQLLTKHKLQDKSKILKPTI